MVTRKTPSTKVWVSVVSIDIGARLFVPANPTSARNLLGNIHVTV